MAIVFLSGGITGIHDGNKKEFLKAEQNLIKQGYVVLNPTVFPIGLEHHQYMNICKAMINESDIVYFMRGFEYSRGSNEEYIYAKEKNKLIIHEGKIDTEYIPFSK